MLDQLLHIKELHRDNAQLHLSKAHAKLERNLSTVAKEKKSLNEYQIWRVKEEDRLFDEVKGKDTLLIDLTDMRMEVADLYARNTILKKAVLDAEIAVQESRKLLAEAQMLRKKAEQKVQKYEETIRVLNEGKNREKQRLEDLELEEFSVKSPLIMVEENQNEDSE